MFIVIQYGYKQQQIFTIDVLTATLIDCMWSHCMNDMINVLQSKQETHAKEIQNLQKKIVKDEQKLEQVVAKMEEEAQKQDADGVADKKKKDDKKGKSSKKGKEQAPTDPLEIEKLDLENKIKEYNEFIEKYNEKIQKIEPVLDKYQKLQADQNVIVELVDKTGERKFVKTKLDLYANEFLSDKNTYVVSVVNPAPADQPDQEDEIQICDIEGFLIRSCEEDKDAPPDEPLVEIKKDDKKGKKKGKK